jgi:hypothetical protein
MAAHEELREQTTVLATTRQRKGVSTNQRGQTRLILVIKNLSARRKSIESDRIDFFGLAEPAEMGTATLSAASCR